MHCRPLLFVYILSLGGLQGCGNWDEDQFEKVCSWKDVPPVLPIEESEPIEFIKIWSDHLKNPVLATGTKICFSGEVSLEKAITDSQRCLEYLQKDFPVLLAVGGGNEEGRWTTKKISDYTVENYQRIKDLGYAGVSWDIEEVEDVDGDWFQGSFAAVKELELFTHACTSHSSPYHAEPEELKADIIDKCYTSDSLDSWGPMLYAGYEFPTILQSANDYPFRWSDMNAIASRVRVYPIVNVSLGISWTDSITTLQTAIKPEDQFSCTNYPESCQYNFSYWSDNDHGNMAWLSGFLIAALVVTWI